MYEKEVEQLQNIIDDSKRIVFFGGAGVSTESNIPECGRVISTKV